LLLPTAAATLALREAATGLETCMQDATEREAARPMRMGWSAVSPEESSRTVGVFRMYATSVPDRSLHGLGSGPWWWVAFPYDTSRVAGSASSERAAQLAAESSLRTLLIGALRDLGV
jgi:hypothetical protein